jgi:hypothetical protein
MQSTRPTPDLVKTQKNVATLNHLVANYNQLYKTYLQQVEAEASKRDQRKYPYNIKSPNEFKNNLTPAYPFPSNGTEDACFKSCVETKDCAYALYSNSGCGIDCNPNKCLLYPVDAGGVAPVKELPTSLPTCPAASSNVTDAWCKTFNHPVTNAIIPAIVIRTGGSDWRTLAMQLPTSMANAADAPFSVNMTTNVQSWGPDSQFRDVNYAPSNEISLQFRFFAEYWLNAYDIMSGSAPVVAGQGPIGTFAFAKLTKMGSDSSTSSYAGTFGGQTMFWNSAEPSTGGTAAGQKTAADLAATTSESAKFNYNYSAFENSVWKIAQNENGMSNQVPPQLAGLSIPSWQFLGVQDSAEACQRAASDDPAHVYSLATYYNASYSNPNNGSSVFARMCYGHVAGAPTSTASSATEDNAQTMTPPHGFTKLGGKNGIAILKKMYQLNEKIVALTEELKISDSSDTQVKEGFAQSNSDHDPNTNTRFLNMNHQFKRDKANLDAAMSQLDADAENTSQLLLQSRIKFGVALVIGLLLAYVAFRFLTAEELPTTIVTELGATELGATELGATESLGAVTSPPSSDIDIDSGQ